MSNLYIGLGEAGIDAAVAIYKKKSQVGSNRNADSYLLIDTDFRSQNNLPPELQRCYIDIGKQSPSQIKQAALLSPLKRWFVGWYDYYDYTHSLHDGSCCVRQYGRIAFFDNYHTIYQQLECFLCQLEQSLLPTEQLHIYIITGSCGGTGSAIAMDVLYMIQVIMKSGVIQNVNLCNHVSLLVALPELWIAYVMQPDVQYKFVSNVVAFFKELQFAMDNKNTIPSPYYPTIPPERWMENAPFNPFEQGYAIESSGKTKEQVSQDIADLVCSFGEANQIIPPGVHHLDDGILTREIDLYKGQSDGRYSFVDWKFARQVLDLDKDSDVGTEEIWNRMCRVTETPKRP